MTKEKFIIPPVEEIRYLDNEEQQKITDSYNLEVDSYSSISSPKVYGPMENYPPSSSDSKSNFKDYSIEYVFNHGSTIKHFFKISGTYTNTWKISGEIWELKRELRKLESGEITVVKLNSLGNYERDEEEKSSVEDKIREQIEKFKSAENRGETIDRHARLEWIKIITQTQKEESRTYRCPTVTPDKYEIVEGSTVRRGGGRFCETQ